MKFLKLLRRKISDLGSKKCVCILVGIIIVVLAIKFAWGLEKNITVKSIVQGIETLSEDKVIEVTRTMKASNEVSVSSASIESISNISNEADAINAFNDLASACSDASTKKEKLVIPKGAGITKLGGVEIYTWCKTGEHFITETKFDETHAVILYDGKFIDSQIYSKFQHIIMGVEIQGGKY